MSTPNAPAFLAPPNPEPEDANPTVTLTCGYNGCTEQITGPERGRGSAAWKLGTHQWAKHGIRTKSGGQEKPKLKAGEPSADELGAQPITAGIKSVAAAVGKGKGAPNADQLTNGLGRALGLASVGMAVVAAETDPYLESDEQKAGLVDFLSLPESAARDIMRPIARAVAPTKINTRYGRQVVDNVDVIGSFIELGSFLMHWKQYLKLRAGAPGPGAAAPAVPLAVVPNPQPTAPPAPFVHSPSPTEGMVVTPDVVATMMRNG